MQFPFHWSEIHRRKMALVITCPQGFQAIVNARQWLTLRLELFSVALPTRPRPGVANPVLNMSRAQLREITLSWAYGHPPATPVALMVFRFKM